VYNYALCTGEILELYGCRTCKGDLTGDGWVMMDDYFAMVALLGQAGPPYIIDKCDPLWNPCADMDGNGFIMQSDLYALIGCLGQAGEPYIIPCPACSSHSLSSEEAGSSSDAAEQTIIWLEEIWANDPKLRESMTEAEWQGFMEKVLQIMLY